MLLRRGLAAAEAKCGPGEATAGGGGGAGDLFVGGGRRGVGREGVEGAGGVVVSAAGGVGEGVVGVVYLLEALGASGAFRGVGGNTVRVVFEGCSKERSAAVLYRGEYMFWACGIVAGERRGETHFLYASRICCCVALVLTSRIASAGRVRSLSWRFGEHRD